MNYSDRYLREIASYSVLDVMLRDEQLDPENRAN
jgi:hypothetical protein